MRIKRIVFIILKLFAIGLFSSCSEADDAIDDSPDLKEHKVVALFPMTGSLGNFGEKSAKAARLAAADVNEWLEEEGADWRLRLEVNDTQTEGSVALRKMQSWHEEGVDFFAGPMASGPTRECLSFANANEILYISPASTSPRLGGADDWLFRFCADDLSQGQAIGAVAREAGAKQIIFGWRGDTWEDGLQEAAETAAMDLGIEVYPDKLRFDPLKEDVASDVALLDEYVTKLIEDGVALENIAFNLIALEEAVPFLAEAAGYDQLWDIIWIGSDGTAYSEAIASHPTGSEFAATVKLVNTMIRLPELPDQSLHGHVSDHIQETLGRDADVYSCNSYDIIWGFALAFNKVGYDTAAVRDIMPGLIDEWSAVYGSSGHIVLDEFGDRAFADYDYIVLSDDYKWVNSGYYDGENGTIVWFED